MASLIERPDGHFANVFVPTFAPQYQAMVARAEIEPPHHAQYGHSLEDRNRMGIWVPYAWLTSQKPTGRSA